MRRSRLAGAGQTRFLWSPSTFPAVKGGVLGAGGPACQTGGRAVAAAAMVSNSDIVWLGIACSVIGCLVGGTMLGIGIALIVAGAPIGWLIMLPGAPMAAGLGWLLAQRLARHV